MPSKNYQTKKSKTEELTAKQELFCQEYLIDHNATRAAMRAGYSQKTAYKIGFENLQKPLIKQRIDDLEKDRFKRLQMSQDEVLGQYARLARSDVRNLYDEEGKLKPIHELDDDTAYAISAVDVDEVKAGGETMAVKTTKVKLHDKKAALDSIAKAMKLFVQKHEHSGEDGKPIEVVSLQEKARRVAFILNSALHEKKKQEQSENGEHDAD